MEAAMLSVGGAYRCKEWEATARLGLHAWHLTYLHKLKDLDLVAECEGNLMQVYTCIFMHCWNWGWWKGRKPCSCMMQCCVVAGSIVVIDNLIS